jgi:hypothetical protein
LTTYVSVKEAKENEWNGLLIVMIREDERVQVSALMKVISDESVISR